MTATETAPAPTITKAQHAQLTRELGRAASGVAGARRLRAGSAMTSSAATRIMTALWPFATPHASGRPDWWRTSLGVAVAGALCDDPHALHDVLGDDAVTQAEAADILGVKRGSITSYLQKGYLLRGPVVRDTRGHYGGQTVALSSVLRRVAAQHGKVDR